MLITSSEYFLYLGIEYCFKTLFVQDSLSLLITSNSHTHGASPFPDILSNLNGFSELDIKIFVLSIFVPTH
ncbi:hypothetical protein OA501_02585 [Flavobacteriaceae bacterium]|nr:hypothetical protein [Flavobacteriaceae bacterium]